MLIRYWSDLVCKTVGLETTPCDQKLEYTENSVKMDDVRMYREAVGSLIYLTMCTRPDLKLCGKQIITVLR